jgi:hypothetical protein
VDLEQPIRERSLPAPGPEEVLYGPADEQSMSETTPQGVRLLADFILLLARWDRMLTSSQSEPLRATQQEAA